jgi:tRNA (guanine-N7-)-methyltransferase
LFLATLPAAAKIASVFVLFPDPWPKLRHHKHRILQVDVLSEIAKHAIPDCPLYFRTDHAGSFADTSALITAHADWRIVNESWPHEFVTVFQSKATGYQSLIARRRP